MSDTTAMHETAHHAGAHHEEMGFIRKYVFSTDHKVIGLQYMFTSLLFLFLGYTFMMVMRYQLAYPGQPIPYMYFLGGYGLIGVLVIAMFSKKRKISLLIGLLFLA